MSGDMPISRVAAKLKCENFTRFRGGSSPPTRQATSTPLFASTLPRSPGIERSCLKSQREAGAALLCPARGGGRGRGRGRASWGVEGRKGSSKGSVVEDGEGHVWLVRAISGKAVDFGVLAIDLGAQPGKIIETITKRIDTIDRVAVAFRGNGDFGCHGRRHGNLSSGSLPLCDRGWDDCRLEPRRQPGKL